MTLDAADRHAQFVREHLRVAAVPHVPEVVLYQTDRAIGLWELTENSYQSEQPPPFWAFAWAGGTGLARYLLDHPSLVDGTVDVGRTGVIEDQLTPVRPTSTGAPRAVLDLAAGSGLVAIAALKAGASSAMAVEIDPMAAAAIALNAAENDVRVEVVLDDVLALGVGDLGLEAPLVLAGDVFYSQQMSARMLTFLRRAARDGADVLVGDPGRAYFPGDYFTALTAFDVPVSHELESASIKRVTIYRINPRGAARPE